MKTVYEINKNADKNILIGKIGKSIKFKHLDIRTGGDACMIFYSTIARMNPDYNFFWIGPNQMSKLTDKEYDYIFPNHNVHSAYSSDYDAIDKHPFDPIIQYFKDNNIKIDFALLMSGMCSAINVPNFIKSDKTGEYVKILNAFKNYVGPYIYTLNETGVPFYLISEDARYITTNASDLYNRERIIFTQTNGYFEPIEHITSKTDWTKKTEKIKCIYGGVERIFMMGLDKNWKDNIDIERKLHTKGEHLIVISNGCGQKDVNRANGGKSSRLPGYKKYIIDNLKGTEFEGTKIYGTWDDRTYEKYPQIINKPLVELDNEVADARYSLVYSIMPGFVTVKAWEMIIKGLIPFIHPDYDKDRLLGLPEYCYLKDEKDLLKKMRELDANNDKYLDVLNACFDCIDKDDLNGKRMNNFIFNTIAKDLGFDYINKEGVDSIFDHFSKNVFDPQKV